MKSLVLFLFALFLVFACDNKSIERKISPKVIKTFYTISASQKQELINVVNHYSKNNKDSLKLKAALFLIKEIPRQYFYTSAQLKEFDILFTILGNKSDAWKQNIPWYGNQVHLIIDSLERAQGTCCGVLQKMYDRDLITADLLIEDIDLAFDSWNKPWSKHYTFNQFCEYILPYRATHEKLEKWRLTYLNKLKHLNYELKDSSSALELARRINEVSQLYYQDGINRYPVNISPTNLMKTSFADCRSIANYKLLRMRSMGIATAIDFVPQWANIDHGHYWNSLFDNSGKAVSFMAALNDVHALTAYNSILPKVYRYTWSSNPKVEKLLNNTELNCPDFFLNPAYIDVTDEYVKTINFNIYLLNRNINYKYVYLCLFNKGFNAIDFSEIDSNNTVSFNKVGLNAFYFPMYYDKGKYITAASPFYINSEGKKVDVPCTNTSQQSMTMTRKYHMETRKENWLKSLIGGEIQLSNDKNFTTYVIAHKIQKMPSQHLESAKTKIKSKYRYARFIFSPSELQIKYWGDGASLAELSFFDHRGNELTGKPFGSTGKAYNTYIAENAFDKNPLTFFEDARLEGTKYVALDFMSPRMVSEIKYWARNDMNDIQAGDEYELMYFDGNSFSSLGRKMSSDTLISFTNVPKDAVYWLKDLSHGSEERIFTYEEGKQVWW